MARLLAILVVMSIANFNFALAEERGEEKVSAFIISTGGAKLGSDVDATVVRNEISVPILLGMPLVSGDLVRVNSPNVRIVIQSVDGSQTQLAFGDEDFLVSGEGIPLWTRVKRLASGLTWHAERPPINLMTRDPNKIDVPSISEEMNYVSASPEPLVIHPVDGMLPITLELISEENLVAKQTSNDMPFVVDVDLKAGQELQLWLTDARGDTLQRQISVVEPTALESAATQTPFGDFGVVLSAAELAQQQGGAWRLEAIRRASTLPSTFQPGQAFIKAMVLGDDVDF